MRSVDYLIQTVWQHRQSVQPNLQAMADAGIGYIRLDNAGHALGD